MHWRHLEYFWKNVEDPCHRCVTCSSWIRIVMKLPQTLQSSWRKLVHVIEENCKDVMFEDLVKFIDQQWQIHPVFSADALQEAENKVKSGKQQFNLNRSDRKTLWRRTSLRRERPKPSSNMHRIKMYRHHRVNCVTTRTILTIARHISVDH